MVKTNPATQIAVVLKALGHPARLQIMQTLAQRESCVCGEIVEVIGLAQSTVSQHLKVLKQAGLIQGTVDGQRSCYCIDRKAVAALQNATASLCASWTGPSAQSDETCC